MIYGVKYYVNLCPQAETIVVKIQVSVRHVAHTLYEKVFDKTPLNWSEAGYITSKGADDLIRKTLEEFHGKR